MLTPWVCAGALILCCHTASGSEILPDAVDTFASYDDVPQGDTSHYTDASHIDYSHDYVVYDDGEDDYTQDNTTTTTHDQMNTSLNDPAVEVNNSDHLIIAQLQRQVNLLEETRHNLLGERLLKDRQEAEGELSQRHSHPLSVSVPRSSARPMDCADHLVNGAAKSGVYSIYPFTCLCSKPVKVWCDMETDGGGWTVLLNRDKKMKQVNFNRNWKNYRDGFGKVIGEFWLGNELIHSMTRSRNYQLRMDVKIGVQSYRYSLWSSIVVESEVHKYRLNLGTYLKESTTRLNCLSYAKSKFFSTFDRDHDSAKIQNCADTKKGGWWYNRCSSHPIPTTPFGKGQVASSCFTKNTVEPAWIQLKIRPAICSSSLKTIFFNSNNCGGCQKN